MQSLSKRQQIIILISGICIELIIGVVYAYSVIRLQLENNLNINHTESSIPYLTSLAVFAVIVMLSGRLMKKSNFYLWAILGIFSVGLGYIVSAYSTHYLTYTIGHGILIGGGVGVLYGIPIQIIQTVYEKNQGLVVGLTIAGFGLSTVVVAPLLQFCFENIGFQNTLLSFGIGSTILLSIFLYFMISKLDLSKLYIKNKREKVHASKWMFTVFFIIFTLGIMFGLSMIGLTVYIGMDYFHLSVQNITLYMSLFALANGLFRPLFGFIYDKMQLKFSVIFIATMTLLVASSYVFLTSTNIILFIITITLSWGSVGGWLALMPIITKDLFGKNNFNKTYGNMYLSYGVAAVIGNLYTSILIDNAISLSIVFIPIIIVSLFIITFILFMPIRLASLKTKK